MDLSTVKNDIFTKLDNIENENKQQAIDAREQNSVDNKLRCMNQCKDKSQEICLDKIFAKIYKDALPLNDDYKVSYGEDIDVAIKDFMNKKCPEGMVYYIHEERDKGNEFAKRVCEAVEKLVDDEYKDQEMNIENIDYSEIQPIVNDEKLDQKIDDIANKLELPQISEIVNNNVKNTAMSEIIRAKDEKEKLSEIEKQIASDVNVNNQEAVESALEFHDVNLYRDYIPSLFEGVMVNKTNNIIKESEEGNLNLDDINLYNTLDVFYDHANANNLMDLAFVETVKEYTGLSILKALKFEDMTIEHVNDLASKYAQGIL